ncbi:MAG: hypothetical protein WDN03_09465 [Rhizomicrobium sp.]
MAVRHVHGVDVASHSDRDQNHAEPLRHRRRREILPVQLRRHERRIDDQGDRREEEQRQQSARWRRRALVVGITDKGCAAAAQQDDLKQFLIQGRVPDHRGASPQDERHHDRQTAYQRRDLSVFLSDQIRMVHDLQFLADRLRIGQNQKRGEQGAEQYGCSDLNR